jgi:prephenate dehydrogenase
VTRLASGDPQMQRDICLTNRTALIRWLNETAALLLEMRDMLQAEEAAQLEALFEQTRQTRDAWLASKPHLRPGEEDFAHFPQVERPGLLDFLRPSRRKGKQE